MGESEKLNKRECCDKKRQEELCMGPVRCYSRRSVIWVKECVTTGRLVADDTALV